MGLLDELTIDREKLRGAAGGMAPLVQPVELRRTERVFFVGGKLPARETLETVFDSFCLAPVELFYISFGGIDTFDAGVALTRQLKKNFSAPIYASIASPLPAALVERAYAAGVDYLELPFPCPTESSRAAAVWQTLTHARTVFPSWSVVALLPAGKVPVRESMAAIDQLLAAGVVPLPRLSPPADAEGEERLLQAVSHLLGQLQRCRVSWKPLLPIFEILLPVAAPRPKRVAGGLLERFHVSASRATADLRRLLRTRAVEDSFESAGL